MQVDPPPSEVGLRNVGGDQWWSGHLLNRTTEFWNFGSMRAGKRFR